MTAEEMLDELLSNRLEVVLTPAPNTKHYVHFVRRVQSANCDWYRKFCASFRSSRKDQNSKGRTLIKRKATVHALEKIIEAQDRQKLIKGKGAVTKLKATAYVERFLKFIEFENKQRNKRAEVIEDDWMPF